MAAMRQTIVLQQTYQPPAGQGFQSVSPTSQLQMQCKQAYPTHSMYRPACVSKQPIRQQLHHSLRVSHPQSAQLPSSPISARAQPSIPFSPQSAPVLPVAKCFSPTSISARAQPSIPFSPQSAPLQPVAKCFSPTYCSPPVSATNVCQGPSGFACWQQPLVRPISVSQPSSLNQIAMPMPVAKSCEGAPTDVLNRLISVLRSREDLTSFARTFFERKDIQRRGLLSFAEGSAALSDVYASLRSRFDTPEQLLANRMKKRDIGQGQLDCEGFIDVCRWCLWHKYQELVGRHFSRSAIVGQVHRGVPSQFYSIGKKLGEGSFGIVHEATCFSSGNQRVMKTINKSRCMKNGMPLEAIEGEIEILATLDHPHVLRMFEHYRDSENFYMILEVCRGGELLDIFKAEVTSGIAVPEPWLAKVFRQIIEALAYIHGKGVMHKDLKLENVMLRDRDSGCFDLSRVRAVVIDVGLAELFGSNHSKGSRSSLCAGTLDTMAPEVIARDFSYKCDIWSTGCMLFAIFNQNPTWVGTEPKAYPFPPMNPPEAMRAVQARGPPMHLLANASVGVRDAVTHMLSFNEETRPSAAQCLMLPWIAGNVQPNMLQFSQGHARALTSHIHATHWSRAALLEAALELPASSLQKLEEMFGSLDTDHDGVLSEAEVLRALVTAGVSHQAAAKTAKQLSTNGAMEFSDFVATILPSCKEIFCQSLQIAFQKLDTNRDGVLDANEVLHLLNCGEIQSAHLPSDRVVELMMRRMHGSAKGGITFPEFQEYFLSQMED